MNKFFVLMGFILMFSSCFFAEISVSDSYSELVTPEFNIQVPDVVTVKAGGVVRIPISIVAKQDTVVELDKLDTNKLKFQGFLKPVNVEKTLSVPAKKYKVYDNCLVDDGSCVGNSILPKLSVDLFSVNVSDSVSLPVVKDVVLKDGDLGLKELDSGFDSFVCDVVENVNGVDYCLVDDGFDYDDVSFVKKVVSVPMKSVESSLLLSSEKMIGWIDVVVPRDVGSYKYDVVYGDWVLDPVVVVEDWNVSVPEGDWVWLFPRVDDLNNVWLGWSGWLEHETPVKELDSGSASFFDDSVLAYYKFNGNSEDYSDNGHSGSDVNVTYVNGKWGTKAAEFDGTSSYIDLGNPSDLNLIDDFSISVWIKPYSLSHPLSNPILSKRVNLDYQYQLRVTKTGYVSFLSGNGISKLSASTIPLNSWSHIFMSKDGNVLKFYINGVLDANYPNAAEIIEKDINVLIGWDRQVANTYWNGLIDELVVFDRVLSADEVRSLYNDASVDKNLIAYYHLNDNNGTHVFNSAPATSDKYHGEIVGGFDTNELGLWDYNAGSFDGVNDAIDTGSDWLPLGNLTISAWINPNGIPVAGRILENGSFFVYFFKTQMKIGVSSNNSANLAVSIKDSIELNKWTHVLVTRKSDGIIKIYINGVDKTATTNDSGTPVAGTSNVIIGNRNAMDRNWGGLLQDVKIWNKILSEEEIISDFNAWKSAYYESDVIDVNDEQVINSIVVNEGYPLNSSELSESSVLYDANLLALYNFNGNALDSSLGGHGGSATNMSWKPGLWQTQAAEFNGTNSGIDTGSDWLPLGDLTISAWINPNGNDFSNAGRILDNGSLFVYFIKTQMKIGVLSSNKTLAVSDINSIELNKWQHVVVTRKSDGTTKIYINGVDKSTTVSPETPIAGTSNVIIGNRNTIDRGWGGLIEDLAVWNKILSPDDINELYLSQAQTIYSQYKTSNDEELIETITYSNPNYSTDSNILTSEQQKFVKVKVSFDSINNDTAKLYNIGFDFVEDTNAPTTLVTYNSTWINEDQNFEFTCFDSENSCKTFYYRLDTNAGLGVNYTEWNAVDWNGNYEIIDLIPNDGNIAIQFYSSDQLDNNELIQTIYSTKSKTNPTINITSPTSNYSYFTIDASYSITMTWDSNSYPEPQSNQTNTYVNHVKNGTYANASCIATGEFTKSCSGVVELNLGYAEKKPNTLKAKTVMVSANEVEDSVLVYIESGIESKYPNLIYTGLIILILVGFLLGVFSFISPDSFEVGIWQFLIVIVFVIAMIIAIMGALL